MLKVVQLTIYPIKGLAGINVESASALEPGFEYDRRWMLIDENNKFISQRTDARLALIRVAINENDINVQFQDKSISYAASNYTGESIKTNVWDDTALCYEVNHEVSTWFSDILGINVRLVKMCSETSRIHHSSATSSDFPVSLADAYPYLIVGTASAENLVKKMNQDVDISRFRPNIVISTTEAHEEDLLTSFTIGSATFANIKPCARCQVITVDQTTGHINKAVLKTLSTYRTTDNKVYFGTNVVCKVGGEVRVGDVLKSQSFVKQLDKSMF